MAKVKLSPALEAIHGHVGEMVFKRFAGHEIVGKMPDRTGIVPSANQLAQQDKFRLAALYGKAVLADPETKQVYQDAAARKGIPAFALTVADFLNAPAVDEIDLSAYRFTLAITGFGDVLLRYLKTVRERGWKTQKAGGKAENKK